MNMYLQNTEWSNLEFNLQFINNKVPSYSMLRRVRLNFRGATIAPPIIKCGKAKASSLANLISAKVFIHFGQMKNH